MPPSQHPDKLWIRNVHIWGRTELHDICCSDGLVESVAPAAEHGPLDTPTTVEGGVLLPSLCHAHVHLDKCFILDQCDDLVSGDFKEALEVTSKAKEQFSVDLEDLYKRGKRLIKESLSCGVTSMRVHVEVDTIVKFACLDTAQRLKNEFEAAGLCDMHIAIFAQDPLYGTDPQQPPAENFKLLRQAASRREVSAVGSAPYVEASLVQSRNNIVQVLDLAQNAGLHADFHLDYNLNASSVPLVHFVIEELRRRNLPSHLHVTVGHATRLTLFDAQEWKALAEEIADLPISFVGLPQSDLYMMGREPETRGPGMLPVRGTLDPTRLYKEHGLNIALSINNVDNAFTPQGSSDPLSLCPLGVAVFQAGTVEDCSILLKSVTINAKKAIAEDNIPIDLVPRVGQRADFVVLHGNSSVASVALNPCYDRTTIKAGVIVARRSSKVSFPVGL